MFEADWELLNVIRNEKSIRKAAEKLYVSQPSLTYRLQQLEKEFETQLFLRTSKGMEITAQGELLYQHIKSMVHKLQELKENIKIMSGKIQGVLRIGVFPIASNYQLPDILNDFIKINPGVQIKITTDLSYKLIQLLFSEEIHLAIVRGDHHHNTTAQNILLREDPICILSKNPIVLDDLPQMPRIDYDTKSSFSYIVDDWWYERFAQPPKVVVESDNANTCVKMVEAGIGYALLSYECLKDVNLYTEQLRMLNGQLVTRKTWLLYREPVLNIDIVRTFIDFLKTNSLE